MLSLILLAACAGPPAREPGAIPDAIPRVEPKSRYGNPDSYVVFGERYHVLDDGRDYVERGIASWYGDKFHGRRASSGEIYDMHAMTAAHKTLPLPTYVRVTNLDNGRSAIVRVNDRGPFVDNRLIDLSYAAALKLGIIAKGTGLVEVRAVDPRNPSPPQPPQIHAASMEPAAEMAPETSIPKIFIQVGAFASRLNAERLRDRLSAYDLGAIQIQPGSSHERAIYRVQIGPMASVEDTDRTAAKLEILGVHDYHVAIPAD